MESNLQNRSEHQLLVEKFMLLCSHSVPVTPTTPDEKIRVLRAKLILEEALETINKGLGVSVSELYGNELKIDEISFAANLPTDICELIDGCCDLKVVTTGTLSSYGLPDEPFQKEVDLNNLKKFSPGFKVRDDGKIIKPPNHQPPDIAGILQKLY